MSPRLTGLEELEWGCESGPSVEELLVSAEVALLKLLSMIFNDPAMASCCCCWWWGRLSFSDVIILRRNCRSSLSQGSKRPEAALSDDDRLASTVMTSTEGSSESSFINVVCIHTPSFWVMTTNQSTGISSSLYSPEACCLSFQSFGHLVIPVIHWNTQYVTILDTVRDQPYVVVVIVAISVAISSTERRLSQNQ